MYAERRKGQYMTGLAIFEKNEGRKIFPLTVILKDYVGGQMFRPFSVIPSATLLMPAFVGPSTNWTCCWAA